MYRELDAAVEAERDEEPDALRSAEAADENAGDVQPRAETDGAGELDERAEYNVVGRPDELAQHWEGQPPLSKDCDIYAEGTALKAFGREFDPDRIRAEGIEGGDYTPGEGTMPGSLGRVWERAGLAVERYGPIADDESRILHDADEAFGALCERLEEGKAVVVAVESQPLWGGEGGGHALWVTGIERAPGGETHLVCNDSGFPEGAGARYRWDDFEYGWRQTDYQMVATEETMEATKTS